MCRHSILASTLTLLMGCTVVSSVVPQPSSLDVTDGLRDACRGLDDVKIRERLAAVSTRRDDGETFNEQLLFRTTPPLQCDPEELCPGFLIDNCPPCETCWVAVTKQVYGVD